MMDQSSVPFSRRGFFGAVAGGALAGAFAAATPALAWATGTDAGGAVGAAGEVTAPGGATSGSTTSGSAAPGGAAGGRKGLSAYAMPSTAEDPEHNPVKRVLVVVDYQVDFVDGGVFGRIEPAVAIEDALYQRVREYQDNGDIVIYTMDTHPTASYAETREGAVNPPHCIPGTEGWEVYGRLRELLTPERAIMIKKGTYGSVDLPFVIQALRNQGVAIDSIELAGVSTTCRVLNNAILVYNFFPDLPILFDEGTTASYTDEATQEQLAVLESWGFIIRRR